MKTVASAAVLALLLGGAAFAQQAAAPSSQTSVHPMTTLPESGTPVNNYYRQDVYDSSDNKIGQVADLLVEKEGRIAAVIVSVGGFLGVGEKDVAVPFNAVRLIQKDQKWYLVMNTNKDALKTAPGFKHDKGKDRWVPEVK